MVSRFDNFTGCPKKSIFRPLATLQIMDHGYNFLVRQFYRVSQKKGFSALTHLTICSLFQDIKKKQDQDQALPMCLSVFRKSKTLCKQWIMTVISAKTELLDRQRDKVSNGECNNLSLDQLKQRQRQRK